MANPNLNLPEDQQYRDPTSQPPQGEPQPRESIKSIVKRSTAILDRANFKDVSSDLKNAIADLTRQLAESRQEVERLRGANRTIYPYFFLDVLTFMRAMGQPVATAPSIPPQNIRDLRDKLNHSEMQEIDDAVAQNDLVGIADGIADLIYVLVGMAIAYGIPLAAVWNEVQRANMSKLWTKKETETIPVNNIRVGWKVKQSPVLLNTDRIYVVWDEHGKVQKPPAWQEPNISGIIQAAVNAGTKAEKMTSHASASNPEALTPEALETQEKNREKWNKALVGDYPPHGEISEPKFYTGVISADEIRKEAGPSAAYVNQDEIVRNTEAPGNVGD